MTINNSYSSSDTIIACQGDTITFHDGTVINGVVSNQQHTSFLNTILSCDSNITTTLIVNPNYAILDTLIACQGDTITFHDGTVINGVVSNQQHTSFLNTILSCDSNITTTLLVNPSYNLSIQDTICQGGSYVFAGNILTSSGVYSNTFTNSFGCDSIITLNLFVKTIDTLILQAIDTLIAMNSANSYQWVKCDSSMQIIVGATNYYYIPSTNGIYAVILTQNGCTDTSECFTVNNVGITTTFKENFNISIYPNPTNSFINIEIIDSKNQFSSFDIYDNLGKKVYIGNLNNNKAIVNLSNLSNGIYTVVIVQDDLKINRKIVIQK